MMDEDGHQGQNGHVEDVSALLRTPAVRALSSSLLVMSNYSQSGRLTKDSVISVALGRYVPAICGLKDGF